MIVGNRSVVALRPLAGLILLGSLAACKSDSVVTPPPPNPTLDTPSNFQAAPRGATSANVRFNAVASATGYKVERATGASGGTFAQVGTLGALASPCFDDVGLTVNTSYRYRVTALAAAGTNPSNATNEFVIATPNVAAPAKVEAVMSCDVLANRTLSKDTNYTLSGYVKIRSGATLTIAAGTKIVGDLNTPGSSLWILRGAKISAIGTAAEPIVFTSANAAGSRKPGDWGGIIFVG
ncbi:MAG: hypothetical protein ABJD07_13215, partial [Gemmatimonadaceae bacterium]